MSFRCIFPKVTTPLQKFVCGASGVGLCTLSAYTIIKLAPDINDNHVKPIFRKVDNCLSYIGPTFTKPIHRAMYWCGICRKLFGIYV